SLRSRCSIRDKHAVVRSSGEIFLARTSSDAWLRLSAVSSVVMLVFISSVLADFSSIQALPALASARAAQPPASPVSVVFMKSLRDQYSDSLPPIAAHYSLRPGQPG